MALRSLYPIEQHGFGSDARRKDRLDEVSSGEFALAPGKRPLRAMHA
jgi:hypothetical protein